MALIDDTPNLTGMTGEARVEDYLALLKPSVMQLVVFTAIVGLAIAAYLLNVPTSWIAVGIIVLLGIGILMATSRTRPRDPPPPGSGPQPPAG